MIQKSNLKHLRKSVNNNFSRIQKLVLSASSTGNQKQLNLSISYATIEGGNNWANFIRSFYLSMVIGTKRESGRKIQLGNQPASINNAIGIAVRHCRKSAIPNSRGIWRRRDEPAWFQPNILIALAKIIQADNLAELYSAFSIQTRVFADLPVFRNFFAHRNQQTAETAARKAPNYGIPSNRHPEDILMSRALGRPQPIILDWLDDLKIVCEMLCS